MASAAYVAALGEEQPRLGMLEPAAKPRAKYAPALDRDQWQALADICRDEPGPS